MTMMLIELKKTATLKRAIPMLVAVLLALALACSGEPQVQIVEVEKIVEVEVIREVEVPVGDSSEVDALKKKIEALEAALEESRAASKKSDVSNGSATDNAVLIVSNVWWDRFGYSRMQALGHTVGIRVDVTEPLEPDSLRETLKKYQSLIMINYDAYVDAYSKQKAKEDAVVRDFASSGGNVAYFVIECFGGGLRDTFGVTCGDAPGIGSKSGPYVRRGEEFAPFWRGLFLQGRDQDCDEWAYRSTHPKVCGITIELFPGPEGDFRCVANAYIESGPVCTALYGKVGNGNVIFMTKDRSDASAWVEDHIIALAENEAAGLRLLGWLIELPDSSVVHPGNSFDAASILARFSITDALEGEARAGAVEEIVARYKSGYTDTEHLLDLLHTVAPELSIEERRNSAQLLAQIAEDGSWDEKQTAQGVFYLATLIAGEEPNAEERLSAAQNLADMYEDGNLTADAALHWMDIIAPSLGISERRQAAASLAKLASDGELDETERIAAASETFRLVTGVPLSAEQRASAAVDLAGVGVKIFDTEDSFEDRDIDNATEIIKQSLTGELTTDSLQKILEFDN